MRPMRPWQDDELQALTGAADENALFRALVVQVRREGFDLCS